MLGLNGHGRLLQALRVAGNEHQIVAAGGKAASQGQANAPRSARDQHDGPPRRGLRWRFHAGRECLMCFVGAQAIAPEALNAHPNLGSAAYAGPVVLASVGADCDPDFARHVRGRVGSGRQETSGRDLGDECLGGRNA